MPFNNKRNSRDDNSNKGRSNSESFKPMGGRNQQSSSSQTTGKFDSNRSNRYESDRPFKKFERSDKKDHAKENRDSKSFGGERSENRGGRSFGGERSENRGGRSFGGERSENRGGRSFGGERSENRGGRSFG
ncbi:MAG: hypothetical protein ACTIKE_10660, partial [Sphingobacterium sp.]